MSCFRIVLIALSMVAALNGCSYARRADRAETAERAKTELVGLSKSAILTCAGVPERSAREGGLEFLTYVSGSSGWRGSCVVTFVMKDDSVTGVSYSGRTGRRSQSGEQCAYTVANCLAMNDQ